MLHSKRISAKVAAVVLGVVSVGGPVLLFNAWLKAQRPDESSIAAARALAAIEMQFDETATMLRALSERGIDSCQPAHIEAMRQAALLTGSIKEVMLVSPGGQIMCPDQGGVRYALVQSSSTASADIMLDMLRIPDHPARYIRVRVKGPPGKPSLSGLLHADALVSRARALDRRESGDVLVTLPGGRPIDGRTEQALPQSDAPLRHRVRSQRYMLTVAATAPRRGLVATDEDRQWLGMLGTGGLALVILLAALLVLRRKPDSSVADMAKAVLANEFEPHYQPTVDIQSGRLLGAEVLVRWKRPDGDVIEPNAFISLMETSGLMPEMTRALMQRVRQDLGPALGARPAMTVAFNIAPQHFDDALILSDVGTIFGGSPIRLSQIVLELTERQEVRNLGGVRRVIAALQGLGCKVAIDNVGTGHSGLSYMLKLGVDIVKIDRIFVEAIANGGHSRAIIETLIDLAKNMRMEIVAEGVETFDQVAYLRERGITAAQGFVFAPPLPAGSFLKLVEAMDPAGGGGQIDRAG